ncbi:MAG: PEGA domain-containing protein [Candidatus Altiarchaeota archaeon]
MNVQMVLLFGFILFMFVAIAVLVGGIIYLDSSNPGVSVSMPQTQTSTTSSSTTSTSTTSSTQAPPEEPTTTTASTTTTLQLKPLLASFSPKDPYKGDDVIVNASSYGTRLEGLSVYLDGRLYGGCDIQCELLSMGGGSHTVVLAKMGYENATLTVELAPTTYANSPAVRTKLTPAQRQAAMNAGKASLRVYDSPGCTICAQVMPMINKFVDNNRECVAYEKLHAYDHVSDPDVKSFGVTTFPLIVVEGSRGKFKANGYVTAAMINNLVVQASGCAAG